MKLLPGLRRRHHGFLMNGRVLMFIVTVAFVIGGGQGIYTGLKNRRPLEITCAEFLKERPSVEWVRLTEARLELPNAAFETSLGGKVKEVFVPLRGGSDASEEPIQILLASEDPALLDLTSRAAAVEDIGAMAAVAPEVLRAMTEPRTVEGLVKFGIEAESDTRRKLENLDLPLAEDFILIKEGEKPNLWESVAMLGAGIAIGVFVLCGKGRRTAPKSQSSSQPPPLPTPPPLPPTSMPPPLPHLHD